MDPAMQIAISDRVYFAGGKRFGTAAGLGAEPRPPVNPDAELNELFIPTLGQEDQRRPRMDLGLGIWIGDTRRSYPIESIRERDGAFIDQLDGQNVLIFMDPDTYTPAALFVDASGASLSGKEIRLDGGAVLRSGALYDSDGSRRTVERPQQLFTRWYGFALTFPDTRVYDF